MNDAVMQAIGSYQGGRMLFLGLGTGLGSTMIVDDVIVPMELATCRSAARPSRTTSAAPAAHGSARSAGARRCSRRSST